MKHITVCAISVLLLVSAMPAKLVPKDFWGSFGDRGVSGTHYSIGLPRPAFNVEVQRGHDMKPCRSDTRAASRRSAHG